MKTTVKNLRLGAALLVLLGINALLLSCNNAGESTTTTEASAFVEVDLPWLNAYLKTKNALVASNPTDAATFAKQIAENLSDTANALARAVKAEALKVTATNDLKLQREYFQALSRHAHALAKSGASQGVELYWQYCPMAANGEGAHWLSTSESIRNPYFGNKMLKCGSVKEAL